MLVQPPFMLVQGDRAPIQSLDRRPHVTMDDLDWSLEALPRDRCAEHGMSRDQGLPSTLERRRIQVAVELPRELFHVRPRSRLPEGMEEHAMLHWRQRVYALHIGVTAREGQSAVRGVVSMRSALVADESLQLVKKPM